eukprot:TRINITY_DN41582_c0_g1_i1.p1 TRINITY_DN41582_c0_g1~~TRINITY_DN41582_c0_g1_i1.p1  ORF type:complete len:263 (+),score=40.00 TRINITY_DN41582_c0_g1_i1:45-833(+)
MALAYNPELRPPPEFPPSVPALSFRSRLEALAAEHDDVLARCEALTAENRELREKLSRFQDAPMTSVLDTFDSLQDRAHRLSDGFNLEGTQGEPGEDGGSYSSSSSSSEEAGKAGEAPKKEKKKRRRHRHGTRRRKGGRERHRRRHRRHGHGGHGTRRRSRSRTPRPEKENPGRPPPPGPSQGSNLGNLGYFGCGDHEADIEQFISVNELDEGCAAALRAIRDDKAQMHVMGTDGGENAFVLKDKVRNPSGVVMSRIRRLQQ